MLFGAGVDEWEHRELAAGYSIASVRTWRSTLSTILADAVADGLIAANPAIKQRGFTLLGSDSARLDAAQPPALPQDADGRAEDA